MNNTRRKAIADARQMVEAAFEAVEAARSAIADLRDEEQDYYDNMPESLQGGEKGDRAQEAINALEAAHDELDGFDFESVYNSLDEASQ